MASQRRARSGFTLIELLISLAIMTLLVATSTYAFSLASGRFVRDGLNFDIQASRLQRVDLLVSAIEGSVPWMVEDNDQYGFYFLGEKSGFTFVTTSPIYARGPAVVRILRERTPENSWRLVYEEAALDRSGLSAKDQGLNFTKRLVISQGFRELQFSYFGWETFSARASAIEGLSDDRPKWFLDFDGFSRQQNPQKISINFDGTVAIIFVADRADTLSGRAAVDT
jgi:prepilin-type N-terminal cleavage/methylation domain-containing protein